MEGDLSGFEHIITRLDTLLNLQYITITFYTHMYYSRISLLMRPFCVAVIEGAVINDWREREREKGRERERERERERGGGFFRPDYQEFT